MSPSGALLVMGALVLCGAMYLLMGRLVQSARRAAGGESRRPTRYPSWQAPPYIVGIVVVVLGLAVVVVGALQASSLTALDPAPVVITSVAIGLVAAFPGVALLLRGWRVLHERAARSQPKDSVAFTAGVAWAATAFTLFGVFMPMVFFIIRG